MNVLMIHGIGQEKFTQEELINTWVSSLHGVAPGLFKGVTVKMAYYGTTLADWTTGQAKLAVGMGGDDTAIDVADTEEMKFLSSALEEALVQSGGGEAEIDAAFEEADDITVPMDTFLLRRLVGLFRALEKISPAKGSILLRVVKQGHTYLYAPGAQAAVDAIVRPYLQERPQIIITHSLGTVIAFRLLREMAEVRGAEIPLFITMGSPLGLDAFKKRLGPPRRKPAFVKRWANFYDPSDLVTLGKDLDEDTFAPEIENDGTVDNQTSNAHGIIGYLPHKGDGLSL